MTQIKPNLLAFLEEQQADRTRHSGRMLLDHLVGTHDLLRAWGASETVCLAGLYHSIYGTRRFRHQSWPLNDRDTIRALIGDDAEALVYLFCVTDRPRAFLYSIGGAIYDHYRQKSVPLPRAALRDLLEIEAANLLEQKSHSYILGQLLLMDISDAAKKAIRRHRRDAA